jgi:hypothetical protein
MLGQDLGALEISIVSTKLNLEKLPNQPIQIWCRFFGKMHGIFMGFSGEERGFNQE